MFFALLSMYHVQFLGCGCVGLTCSSHCHQDEAKAQFSEIVKHHSWIIGAKALTPKSSKPEEVGGDGRGKEAEDDEGSSDSISPPDEPPPPSKGKQDQD